MKNFKIFNTLNKMDVEDVSLWIAEAEFGLTHVKSQISILDEESNILEVGCGSGILLAMLSEEFPKLKFNGIEPYGKGFSKLKSLNEAVQKEGVNIKIESYDQHLPNIKYDFIYCINVFEHVDDWKEFLLWASKNLKKNGKFFVLCPNYGFPYESHFKIPIILNKKVTYNLFKNYINKYELSNNCLGLWGSLNFVKKSQLKKYCCINFSMIGFTIIDDKSIMDEMVARISYDSEFKKRQSFVGKIAVILKRVGLFNFVKFFPNFLPYMKLVFVKDV